ncbi:sodium-independent sulfate anion transporter isoform X2 [Anabrus simplex]|uniref:sodium-independent sulfate anion transporter isoform X2 n=1 Tax=Anabrus simplex TaxID=316456 RepID=UPI0035A29BCB
MPTDYSVGKMPSTLNTDRIEVALKINNMDACDSRLLEGSGERSSPSRSYEDMGVAAAFFKKKWRKICSKSFLERKLPIVKWLPTYTLNFLVQDILAGLTVGLTAIPQGIAYAVVAGLEPQYGLYAGFMGAFTYIIFGSCKDVTIGPTAILALMAQKYVENHGADFAVLLTFLSGCIILLLGILNLGFLVDFISMPVTAGFTSAAAITIASSQLKSLLGIKGKSNDFLQSWITVIKQIKSACPWDVLLGVSTIVLLLLAKMLNKYQFKEENLSVGKKIFNKTLWLVSLGRNAFAAVLGTLVAYIFYTYGETPFSLTGKIGKGLPPFQPPPFSTIYNNRTYEFLDMTSELGTSLITLPLIAILETVAIAKAFSKGKALDATQEMIALGLCNITGSFVRSMPVTGSFTRTAVNNASGVKTQMGGLFTGVLVLLALGLLTSTFYFIPKATLAGIIIAAMFYMVEYEVVPLLWRTKKIDLIPLTATFFCCLFISLEYGMLIGVGINLLFLIYNVARPKVNIQSRTISFHDIILVTPDQSLVFPAAEFVRKQVIKTCVDMNSSSTVVVDGRHIHHIDATMAKTLHHLHQDLKIRNQALILWNWSESGRETCIGLDPKMGELFREDDRLELLFKDVPVGSSQSIQGGEIV